MTVILVFALAFLLLAWGVLWHNSSLFVPTLSHGPRGQRRVALTFDDGPDPRLTPLVLDLLAREGVKATFFCAGESARRHPELVRRMHREGHLVANHSYDHDWRMNFWNPRRVARSVLRGEAVLRRLTGQAPRFYRTPVGVKSPPQALVGWRLGLTFVGWQHSARDGGRFRLKPERVRRLGERAQGGDTLLLHDGKWGVPDHAPVVRQAAEVYAQALPALIATLRRRGLEPARLDHVLGVDGALAPAERRARHGLVGTGRLGPSRGLLERLVREHMTPTQLAVATGVGVFVGSTPLFGLHALLGLALSVRLRLNKLAVFLGTNVSNPVSGPVVAFANIQVGCRLLTGRWLGETPEQWQEASLASLGNDALLYWLVGFPIASSLLALAAAVLSYPLFRLLSARAPATNAPLPSAGGGADPGDRSS